MGIVQQMGATRNSGSEKGDERIRDGGFSLTSRGEAQRGRRRFNPMDGGFSFYAESPVDFPLRNSPFSNPLALTA